MRDQVKRHGLSMRMSLPTLGVWLVAFAYLAFCVSDMMLSIQNDNSQFVKIAAFAIIGLAVILRPRFHRRILLVGPMLFVFIVAMLRSFNESAGVEEFQRFIFPVAITVALYVYRDRINLLVSVFVAVVLSNDIFQCYFYLAYVAKLPLLVPVRIDSGLYLRAQGWIGFFSEFGFMNFCALIVCALRGGKRDGFFKVIFLSFALLSFSFKLFVVLALYPIVFKKVGWKAYIFPLIVIFALIGAFIMGYLDNITGLAASKISFYVTSGNSARAESYRVMWESLTNGNMLGEGLGGFGGPASVKYNSPLYAQYHFNWFGMGGILKTTDTFYPHLFVELGLIGGALWLYFVVTYGQRAMSNRIWLFVVISFLFDNAFSLAILSPSYVFCAFLVMYLCNQMDAGKKIILNKRGVQP
ncbi:hypothetical protein [Paraburkholderia bannensis]|uniref:hypothetical protein n=1 Tax=Paraburkholderia bannensis TaxID=765414 RepID=UPI0012EB2570|nr:hypothetical protein [Paraburkholderia bannensis]